MKMRQGLLGAGLLFLPAAVRAQSFMIAPATASVNIMAPARVGETESMGGEVPRNADGTVEVDPSASAAAGRASLKPAAYRVTGRRGAAFALALPGSVTLTAAGASIPVKRFTVSVAGGTATADPGGLTINPRGTQDFKVGATLLVASNQPRNLYSGRFSVTLAYD